MLEERLSHWPLKTHCHAASELVERGLFYDQGSGYGTREMEVFVATDTTRWVNKWQSDPNLLRKC